MLITRSKNITFRKYQTSRKILLTADRLYYYYNYCVLFNLLAEATVCLVLEVELVLLCKLLKNNICVSDGKESSASL